MIEKQYQKVQWLFNLAPAKCFIITPEKLITVTLHATVPFMGCLFIKLTPLETINLMLQRAWPDPAESDEISSFLVHT